MATHELFTNRNGTVSLRELRSGEVMHSCVGPREEATLLYVEQSRLSERLAAGGPGRGYDDLVIWDVGLGAASNALAAFQAARQAESRRSGASGRRPGASGRQAETGGPGPDCRPLRIVSFENDLSGLRLAFENRERLPFFDGFEPAVESLLARGSWRSADDRFGWTLLEGDFRQNAARAPAPELVFYDFYSPNAAPDLWNPEAFALVRAACAGPATLYTYSASTRVRAGLLLAGFFVGYGRSTGAKLETTVAATRLEDLERPLDARWLARLERSHEPMPYGWRHDRRGELLAAIARHPQFRD